MHCPFCSFEESKVLDSRLVTEGSEIRRRRECLKCGERWTTFEVMVPPAGLEPAPPCGEQILSLSRLPISPQGHEVDHSGG